MEEHPYWTIKCDDTEFNVTEPILKKTSFWGAHTSGLSESIGREIVFQEQLPEVVAWTFLYLQEAKALKKDLGLPDRVNILKFLYFLGVDSSISSPIEAAIMREVSRAWRESSPEDAYEALVNVDDSLKIKHDLADLFFSSSEFWQYASSMPVFDEENSPESWVRNLDLSRAGAGCNTDRFIRLDRLNGWNVSLADVIQQNQGTLKITDLNRCNLAGVAVPDNLVGLRVLNLEDAQNIPPELMSRAQLAGCRISLSSP